MQATAREDLSRFDGVFIDNDGPAPRSYPEALRDAVVQACGEDPNAPAIGIGRALALVLVVFIVAGLFFASNNVRHDKTGRVDKAVREARR